jgi:acyl-CoA dehydrogenase
LSALLTELTLLRGEVASGLNAFTSSTHEELNTMASAVRFNNLKVAASEQAPRVCLDALKVCGIVGYKNDTDYSVGRHLRDTLSAALMVTNERIHETNAGLLLIAKDV